MPPRRAPSNRPLRSSTVAVTSANADAINAIAESVDGAQRPDALKRLLGSVGEPINPEAWRWYYEVVGEGRCVEKEKSCQMSHDAGLA